ncbi:hypothetical protein Hamer_G026435, partial [Homarus americanus]
MLGRGAPYYQRFQQLLSRLKDTGIAHYWIEGVLAVRRTGQLHFTGHSDNPVNKDHEDNDTQETGSSSRPYQVANIRGNLCLLDTWGGSWRGCGAGLDVVQDQLTRASGAVGRHQNYIWALIMTSASNVLRSRLQ